MSKLIIEFQAKQNHYIFLTIQTSKYSLYYFFGLASLLFIVKN